MKNIVPYNNTCSLADAVAKYAAYINKESNEIVFEQGYKPKPVEKRKVTTKTEQIKTMIEKGMNMRAILSIPGFGGMKRQIMDNMIFAPKREEETQCLYIYGEPGTGKTHTVGEYLRDLQEVCKPLKRYDAYYYIKCNGFERFWCDYDQEKVVWLEDPGPLAGMEGRDKYENWLQVLGSKESCTVEVKFGQVPFVGRLLIVTTNLTIGEVMKGVHSKHEGAVARRLEKNVFCMQSSADRGALYNWLNEKGMEIMGYPDLCPGLDEIMEEEDEAPMVDELDDVQGEWGPSNCGEDLDEAIDRALYEESVREKEKQREIEEFGEASCPSEPIEDYTQLPGYNRKPFKLKPVAKVIEKFTTARRRRLEFEDDD